MGKRQKNSGSRWERETAKELKGKRQPSSGAFGTQQHISSLTGDVVVEYPWFNKPLHVECKYGYGTSKQMVVKREWLTKVRGEAKGARRYPVLAIKFRDVTGGDLESAKILCINYDTWKAMMKEFSYLYLEYLSMLRQEYERKEKDNQREVMRSDYVKC